jgi:glycosyltransferase involved in cell wall biosynthesis
LQPLRVLTFTTLYPSASRPRHGIFVETRLRQLLALGDVEARVVAPVPWFPSAHASFGRYAAFAATPRTERREGIDVRHPRYVALPGLPPIFPPLALARAGLREARRLLGEGFAFDVIDAHYFYPDGVAAAMIASALGKPLVITARGSDVNVLARLPLPRARILRAARAAHRVVCVSAALRSQAIALGMEPGHVEVLRNGVDTALFAPADRAASRRALVPGLPADAPMLLAVGNLVPEKGLDLAVRTLARLPAAALVIIGDGPERDGLLRLAVELNVRARLFILPPMPQPRLPAAYSAADVLLLASLREGWPNVLLEAMACGTPVVAADVGGVREAVGDAGVLLRSRDAAAWADAVDGVLHDGGARARALAHAQGFDWRSVAERLRDLLGAAASRPASPRLAPEACHA